MQLGKQLNCALLSRRLHKTVYDFRYYNKRDSVPGRKYYMFFYLKLISARKARVTIGKVKNVILTPKKTIYFTNTLNIKSIWGCVYAPSLFSKRVAVRDINMVTNCNRPTLLYPSSKCP